MFVRTATHVEFSPGNGHFRLLTLEACTDDFNCASCGELTSFLPGEWVSFTCPEDTTGNQIRIQNSASALQLCEVQVHGEGKPHCAFLILTVCALSLFLFGTAPEN